MRTDDPLFAGTTSLELWRHDDPPDQDDGCHIGLYYRSNGEKDIFEMRVGETVIPLHPEFPLGFALAAHALLHIAQEFYAGNLVYTHRPEWDDDFTGLFKEWEDKQDTGHKDPEPETR